MPTQPPYAAPCPFCGAVLRPMYAAGNRAKGEVVSYAHPRDTRCIMSGASVGASLLPRWNLRTPPALYRSTCNGEDIINTLGVGVKVP